MGESIATQDEALRDWRRLTDEFRQESDRAAALVAAALLDKNLEDLLRAYLVDDPSEAESMLGGGWKTLGERVRAAYCLGLVSADELADIRIIRDIRNHMAHDLHVSFQDPTVQRGCAKLVLVRRVFPQRHMSYRRRLEQTACMLSVLLVQRSAEAASRRLSVRPELTDLDVRGQCPLVAD